MRRAAFSCLSRADSCRRRVVHTSSFVTIMGGHSNDTPFTEEDNNTRSTLDKGHAYAVSKIRSEQACWEFMVRAVHTGRWASH